MLYCTLYSTNRIFEQCTVRLHVISVLYRKTWYLYYRDLAEAEFAEFLVNPNARYRISRQKSGVAGNRISGLLFTYKNVFIGKFGQLSGLFENRIDGCHTGIR